MIVRRDGYVWKQTFSKGLPTSKLQKLEKMGKNDKTGTTVIFIPDIEIMEDISLDINMYLNEINTYSYLNKGLTFDFIGIDNKGKKISKQFHSKNGMLDYLVTLDNKQLLNKPITFESKDSYEKIIKTKGKKEIHTGDILDMECNIIIQFSKNDTNLIKTYCNGLETVTGGSHLTGFKMAMTEFFSKAVKESNLLTKKDGNIDIIADDIQEGVIALIVVKHSDPVYKSKCLALNKIS